MKKECQKNLINSIKFFSLILTISFIFSSCDSNKENFVKPSESGITSKNGRLIFTNETALLKTINSVSQLTKAEKIQWAKKYNTVLKEESLNSTSPEFLNNFLNKDGVYQIGASIVVIKDNIQYVFNEKNDWLLENKSYLSNKELVTSVPIEIKYLSLKKNNLLNNSSNRTLYSDHYYEISPVERLYHDCFVGKLSNSSPFVYFGTRFQLLVNGVWTNMPKKGNFDTHYSINSTNTHILGNTNFSQGSYSFSKYVPEAASINDVYGSLEIVGNFSYGPYNTSAFRVDLIFIVSQGVVIY